MKNTTLKQTIREAAEFYERLSVFALDRANKIATEDSSLKRELMESHQVNRGRAKAMREALELIEEYLG